MPDLSNVKNQASHEINNRLFFRFFQAANTLHTKGTQALDDFGVTTQQWSVLGALSRPQAQAGMSVNELSRFLLVSRQNLAGLLGRLERDGLIEKATSEEDRRSRKVRLTAKGRALFAEMAHAHEEWVVQAFAGLQDREVATLHRLLGKVKQHTQTPISEDTPS